MDSRHFGGRVALVTGGASGIGAACVHRFAAGEAKVAVADVNKELGEKVVAAVKRSGGEALFLHADVSKPHDVERMVADTVAAFGRLDCAVNNAGIGGELSPTGCYSIEGWQRVIDINLNGVFYCMRHEIPQMVKQGRGAIVNMASILGAVGFALG
jgi:NAD(P)-dependent dehydrogenase (short-subunit alcohol dehydrogenase family)